MLPKRVEIAEAGGPDLTVKLIEGTAADRTAEDPEDQDPAVLTSAAGGGNRRPFGRNLRREAERTVRPGPGCRR